MDQATDNLTAVSTQKPTGKLHGQCVLVTGGGRGLGEAICRQVANEGARVFVADVDIDRADGCASRLQSQGLLAEPVGFDVGDESQVQQTLAKIVERHGRLDVAINNAGVDVTLPIDELATVDWERVLRTNLHGPFLVAKYAAPIMRKQGRGHIVNIASTAAKRAWPNASAYHASKWGLLGLSHALHAELRSQNIKVTAVIAGGMRTPFLLDRFPDIDPEVLQDPDDVARTVAFVLTTPSASVIPEITVLPMRETSWP